MMEVSKYSLQKCFSTDLLDLSISILCYLIIQLHDSYLTDQDDSVLIGYYF